MKNKSLLLIFLLLFVFVATVWAESDQTLEEVRKAIEEKGAKWEAGETWISRLSPEERKKFLGVIPEEYPIGITRPLSGALLPDSFDWRDYNGYDWTTSVKGPQECGNCWAYATNGALEAVVKLTLNEPDLNPNLSELYLCSCGRKACDGWNYDPAFNYVQAHGVVDQGCFPASYPPLAPCPETCDDKELRSIYIENWYHDGFATPSPNVIKDRLLTYGPLPVAMEVYADFFNYQTGIYEHVYGGYEGGHAVVIVGWGEAGPDSFWICKNSWGIEDWGQDGWFKIRMIRAGVGLDEEIWYLTVDSASIPRITVTVPNGGEAWLVGKSQSIRWHAPSPYFSGNVKIQYTTNDGSTWNTITDNTADDGSFTWSRVPDSVSRDCRIMISDAVDGSPVDMSDGTFYIIPLGDVNANVNVGIVDVVYLINYVLRSGPEPVVSESGNVNCDWATDTADIVFLINYVLKNGPRPEC